MDRRPLLTYNRHGVGRPDVIKSEHAIAYTGREPPSPTKNELPDLGSHEMPMREAIRVKPIDKLHKLDIMARINFSKIYTVEHHVKVYNFGIVHDEFMDLFQRHFETVWRYTQSPSPGPNTVQNLITATSSMTISSAEVHGDRNLTHPDHHPSLPMRLFLSDN
jgi:hypothetical protein